MRTRKPTKPPAVAPKAPRKAPAAAETDDAKLIEQANRVAAGANRLAALIAKRAAKKQAREND